MGIAYTEGRSLVSNLIADLTTAILASSDWSRPNSGSRPATFKATTTRGAQIVVDLTDAAIDLQKLTVAFYTSYDGTTLGAKIPSTRYLSFKSQNTGTAAANWVYWTVSVSKEHLFIMLEGPRAADANADNTAWGSLRTNIFACDLVPYFDSTVDPTPVVVVHASPESVFKTLTGFSHRVNVSRDAAGANTWNAGQLVSLDLPGVAGALSPTRVALDGNFYMSPYIYLDDLQGQRGRLSSFFFCGPNQNFTDNLNQPINPGSFVTYNGIKYKILPVYKNNGRQDGQIAGPLGWYNTNNYQNTLAQTASLVAVPYA